MKLQHIAISICAAYSLMACATATRGSTTMLIINTTPTGANVVTNIETKNSVKTINKQTRNDAMLASTVDDLEFTYKGCSPTPCGIEVARRSHFDILVTKEGYTPQTASIAYINRKDVIGKNAKKAALGTGAAAGAGAAAATVAGVTGGAWMAAVALAVAAPVAVIGGSSLAVDAATGANLDLTPNPVDMQLQKIDKTASSLPSGIQQKFQLQRQQLSVGTLIRTTCSVKEPKEVACKKNSDPEKTCSVMKTRKFPCYETVDGEVVN